MSFFISDAMAQEAAAQGDPGLAGLIPLLLIFAIFYFLLLRPQIKRQKEHKKMTESLAKNDEVVTSGGIAGRITALDESFVTVLVADGVELKVQRTAIASLLPKGTVKFEKERGEKKKKKGERKSEQGEQNENEQSSQNEQ